MRKWILGLLLFLVAAGALLNTNFSGVLFAANSYDFPAYWKGARAFVEGHSPYDEQVRREISERINHNPAFGFLYPPPSLSIFIPLAYLPVKWAARVWAIIQLIFLGVIARLLWRYVSPPEDDDTKFLWAGVGALLLFLFYPVSAVFAAGQITFIVAAFMLASLTCFDRGSDFSGGVLLAIGTCLKPTVGVLGLYLLLKRNWRALLMYGAALVTLGGISVLAFGWPLHAEFISKAPHFFPDWIHTWADYQGVKPFWYRTACALPFVGSPRAFARLMTDVSRVLLLGPAVILLILKPWRKLSSLQRFTEFSLLILAVYVTYGQTGNFGIHMVFYTILGLAAAAAWLQKRAAETDLDALYAPAVTWAAAYSLIGFELFYKDEKLFEGPVQIFISSKSVGTIILWGLLVAILWQVYRSITTHKQAPAEQ